MSEWIGIFVRGLFYLILIAVIAPVLVVFRFDQRGPTIDDGVDLGCDDDES